MSYIPHVRALLVATGLASLPGCDTAVDPMSPGSGAAGGKADDTTSSDESLDAVLRELDGQSLTYEQIARVVGAVVAGGATTDRMKLAEEFLERALDNAGDEEVQQYLDGSTALGIVYITMPRDFVIDADAGQTFGESVTPTVEDWPYSTPFHLAIEGTARVDYKLGFKLGETDVVLEIAEGTSALDVANLIADEIANQSETVLENADESSFSFRGDMPGFDDLEADVEDDKPVVVIDPAING